MPIQWNGMTQKESGLTVGNPVQAFPLMTRLCSAASVHPMLLAYMFHVSAIQCSTVLLKIRSVHLQVML